ncbi:hypothetical protein [Gluconobacter potus]|uniref:hypothetical protein n=1 Tax=Gluconobacter potus TaxID=2724927 RepID=UPI000AE99089|nr:hypothetical protein [Gluconobacter potus]
MKTIEYRTMDKSGWGPGPWMHEPDKKQWNDPTTGLPCLIVRNLLGALCGYVGVSRAHPDFERDYDNVEVSVHGGLTFANHCSPGPEDESICHLVEDGEDDHVWWLGFDCAHCDDEVPGNPFRGWRGLYRDFNYVSREVAHLASQLKARGEA